MNDFAIRLRENRVLNKQIRVEENVSLVINSQNSNIQAYLML